MKIGGGKKRAGFWKKTHSKGVKKREIFFAFWHPDIMSPPTATIFFLRGMENDMHLKQFLPQITKIESFPSPSSLPQLSTRQPGGSTRERGASLPVSPHCCCCSLTFHYEQGAHRALCFIIEFYVMATYHAEIPILDLLRPSLLGHCWATL